MTEYENDNQCQCNKQHNCKPYFKEKENPSRESIQKHVLSPIQKQITHLIKQEIQFYKSSRFV